MKIVEILNEIKKMRPDCAIDNQDALKLFNIVDKRVHDEVIATHDMPEQDYVHSSVDEEALIPDEHSGIYILYVFTHYDLVRSETRRYENDSIAYNAAWSHYSDYINRTYMPKQKGKIKV